MTQITEHQVRSALAACIDPTLGTDAINAKIVKAIRVSGSDIAIDLEFGFPFRTGLERFLQQMQTAVASATGANEVRLSVTTNIVAHTVQQGLTRLPEIKNIIAVASGKGGVGKSTTAVNIAVALQAEGAQAGLLDADIYGPSQPMMLGTRGKPETTDGKHMEPLRSYGVQMISIGNLIDDEQPMIWRGPMVTSALQQLLLETNWSGVDYLIVDLPPGTGDIQLTLCQRIPVSAAVIVTTPQDIALLDARRALKMFEKVAVPVVGVVENMSTHVCSHCGHEEPIFGAGGGADLASQYNMELLGSLPLDRTIREGVDNGKPTAALQPESHAGLVYRQIACRLAARLALRSKDYSARFPKIVIEPT